MISDDVYQGGGESERGEGGWKNWRLASRKYVKTWWGTRLLPLSAGGRAYKIELTDSVRLQRISALTPSNIY